MWKLINPIQYYCWGSKTALTKLFAIENPEQRPMAELWMGAHPVASSRLLKGDTERALNALIDEDPRYYLGASVANRFGRLPFLFKVLCAEQALSIQVHPDKRSAEQGFHRENLRGLALDNPQRNYKDDNHKPELLYALTPFCAMNGFRDYQQIAELLTPFSQTIPPFTAFIACPDERQLRQLFRGLLALSAEALSPLLMQLAAYSQPRQQEPWLSVNTLLQQYPGDAGCFMPLLLNTVHLQPGQAMFLDAGTPHAYLSGSGLEIMANSDNVLRAGLTCKHIDLNELMANTTFTPRSPAMLLTAPETQNWGACFPVPVNDFSFAVRDLTTAPRPLSQQGPLILFCINGHLQCCREQQTLSLQPGESLFIAAAETSILLSGEGKIAIAACGKMSN